MTRKERGRGSTGLNWKKVMAKDSDFGAVALGNKEALVRKCQNYKIN